MSQFYQISNLEDYYQTLQHLILPLISHGNLPLTMGIISAIILVVWFSSKSIFRNYRGSNLKQRLISNLIFPLTVVVVLAISLYIAKFMVNLDAVLIFYCLVIFLIISLIRAVNAIITYTFANKAYVKKLNQLTSIILLAVAFIAITDANDNIINLLASIKMPISKTSSISLWDIIIGCTTIVIAVFCAMFAHRFTECKINQLNRIDNHLKHIISRVATILIFFFVLLITLTIMGVDLAVLSVFGGAVGVGIGFGLQKIASNFLSGFIILFDRSIRVGDRLIVDNNAGNVTKITTRYVVLERADGTDVLIPNEKFVTDTIQNQSYSSKNLRVELTFSFGAASDIIRGMELIQETILEAPGVLPSKASVVINKLINGGVEVKAYFWVDKPELINPATNFIYLEMLSKLQENGIRAS